MALEVVNLTKKYGQQLAVDDLTFSAKEGEIIGLLGPNGAGKTTTFKMLTGFIEPTAGSVKINGKNIIKDPLLARKVIGYLPESNPLYLNMYVVEFLKFVADAHDLKLSKKDITDLCDQVGMGSEVTKRIRQLSKGYRQRVGLAQAIIHNPSILILDEPTTGLDANQLVEIRSLIKRLGASKLILFSSHIMQEIEAICDRVIILDKGAKIADNKIESLASSVDNLSTIIIECSDPTRNLGAYGNIKGIQEVNTENSRMIRLTVEDGSDPRVDIFNTAIKNGDIIIHMSKEERSFEQTFQKLTGKK